MSGLSRTVPGHKARGRPRAVWEICWTAEVTSPARSRTFSATGSSMSIIVYDHTERQGSKTSGKISEWSCYPHVKTYLDFAVDVFFDTSAKWQPFQRSSYVVRCFSSVFSKIGNRNSAWCVFCPFGKRKFLVSSILQNATHRLTPM